VSLITKIEWTVRWPEGDEEIEYISRLSKAAFGSDDGYSAGEIANMLTTSRFQVNVLLDEAKQLRGYHVYFRLKHFLHSQQLAVEPTYRRRHGALTLLQYAEHYLQKGGFAHIVVVIPERNTKAQLTYRKAGFRWFRTLQQGEPAERYAMRYTPS
jgi:ribosomal protein S18 acetylase RimI-like enzyme